MRLAFRLLPLPFCIALSLGAQAEDRPIDWRLCPVDDAVPAFTPEQTKTALPQITAPAREQLHTDIEGDRISGTEGQVTNFNGNVALTRGDQFLGTDDLQYDSRTGKYVAQGNVRYQDAGMRMVAKRAEGDQNLDSHNVKNVKYQLVSRRGNGGAEHIELQGAQGSLYGSSYSTCPPSQRMWELRAQRIDVDTDKGFGTARNATLRIGKVPVLYVPWAQFPIDERRRTGLLFPSLAQSGRNGFDWRQPIYLNLAPNYDMTLSPRLMTARGLLLDTQFRYLMPSGAGTLELSYLPSDKLTDRERDEEIAAGVPPENRRKDNRGRFGFFGHQNLNPQWQARANLNWISDARFVEDFSNSLNGITGYSTVSDLGVYGHGRYWNAGLMADHWQLSDYTLRKFQLPYDRLPRAYAQWEQPLAFGLTAGTDAEAVRFQHIDSITRPGGSRVDFKPYLSMPMQGASWFFKPTLAWRYTQYRLDAELAKRIALQRAQAYVAEHPAQPITPDLIAGFRNDSPNRSLPIASVDMGLFFDRQASWRGKNYLQTLEPRLFYLNSPYRNQDGIPLFDTQPLTFSWGQLFRDNRYSGADRQSDAHQITVAVSSRFVRQSDGLEKLAVNLGQIHYLRDSRVVVPGERPIERGSSAWVADANYAVNDRWALGASYQWDAKFRRKDLASFRTRYLIGDDGIVNFNYRYRRSLLEQVDVSFLYPVTAAWSLVGRYYYSLFEDAATGQKPQLLEGIAGVQWDSCCMAARLVGRRYLRNRGGELNNAIQLEIELKGLGSAGPDNEGRLRRAILGYYREDLSLVPPADTRTGTDNSLDTTP